jgi:sulfite reductase alpha subunit-like flavoprotein
LIEHGGLNEDAAQSVLDNMKLRRRFVLDIWS